MPTTHLRFSLYVLGWTVIAVLIFPGLSSSCSSQESRCFLLGIFAVSAFCFPSADWSNLGGCGRTGGRCCHEYRQPTRNTASSFVELQEQKKQIASRIASSLILPATTDNIAAEYDLIVIGAGSAGLTAAKFARNTAQKSVLLIEQGRLGGDCTWTGCVPSKSLLAVANAVHQAHQYGLLPDDENNASKTNLIEWTRIQQGIMSKIQTIYEKDDSTQVLEKMGIHVLSGHVTLSSPRTVDVSATKTSTGTSQDPGLRRFQARQGIVICTGASPRIPASSIDGLESIQYVTYEHLWDLQSLPKRLTVIGGGPVACELAQAIQRLGRTVRGGGGVQVTLVANALLPREEPEVGELLQAIFAAAGIAVITGRVVAVAPIVGSGIASNRNQQRMHKHVASIRLANDGSICKLEGDILLLATGRVPRTAGMGLEDLGIVDKPGTETAHTKDSTSQGIPVNDRLETRVKGVYAAGDCTGSRQFTHYAGYQGAIAARNILLPLSDPGFVDQVPAVTFTNPEVASIGLSKAQAENKLGAKNVAVAGQHLSEVDRAICDGSTKGWIQIVYHAKQGRILGATIVAPRAGEMIAEIAVTMHAGLTLMSLAKVMHPYPTYSMVLQLLAADVYYKQTVRLLPVYNLLKKMGL